MLQRLTLCRHPVRFVIDQSSRPRLTLPAFISRCQSVHAESQMCKNIQIIIRRSLVVAEMGHRGHNRHGPKIGGCARLGDGDGELGPHVTHCVQGRGLLACQVSSVQPFGHNTSTSQTGQTERQRSDSIGRTVLQTVTQNVVKIF